MQTEKAKSSHFDRTRGDKNPDISHLDSAPHFLADQLTLSQPGGAHSPHLVLRAPLDFQNLQRPCKYPSCLKMKVNEKKKQAGSNYTSQ